MDATRVLLYLAFILTFFAWNIWQLRSRRLTRLVGSIVLSVICVAIPGMFLGLF